MIPGRIRTIACICILLVYTYSIYAEPIHDKLSIVPQTPHAKDSLSGRALQLRELLLVEMVNSQMFRVAFEQDEPAAPGSEQSDYMMQTRLTETASGELWSVELLGSQQGDVVFSSSRSIESAAQIKPVVKDLAEEIQLLASAVRISQPADIIDLVDMGQFAQARRLLEWLDSSRQGAQTTDLDHARDRLYAAEAQRAYEDAQSLLSSGYISQASAHITHALSLQPDNPEYELLAEEVHAVELEKQNTNREARLAFVDSLIEQELFSAAERYIQLTLEIQPEYQLAFQRKLAEVQQLATAQRLYHQGLQEFWNREYANAYAHLQEAVQTDPEPPRYQDMLQTVQNVIEEQQRIEKNQTSHRNAIASVQLEPLLYTPRRPVRSLQTVIGRGRQSYIATDADNTVHVPQWVIRSGIMQPSQKDYLEEIPLVSFLWYWGTGAILRVGSIEERTSAEAVAPNRMSIWSLAPYGGAGITTVWNSFSLQTGVELEPQVLFLRTIDRSSPDYENRSSSATIAANAKVLLTLNWHVNEEEAVSIQYYYTLGSLLASQLKSNTEKWHVSGLSLVYSRAIP